MQIGRYGTRPTTTHGQSGEVEPTSNSNWQWQQRAFLESFRINVLAPRFRSQLGQCRLKILRIRTVQHIGHPEIYKKTGLVIEKHRTAMALVLPTFALPLPSSGPSPRRRLKSVCKDAKSRSVIVEIGLQGRSGPLLQDGLLPTHIAKVGYLHCSNRRPFLGQAVIEVAHQERLMIMEMRSSML